MTGRPEATGRFPSIRFVIVVVLAALFVPMLVLFLHTNDTQRDQARTNAEERAAAVVDAAVAEQAQRVRSARTLLTGLAELPLFDATRRLQCERLFRRILRVSPQYANLGAVSAGGRVVCSGVRQPTQTDVSEQAFFRRAVAARGFGLGDYIIGPITRVPVVVVAHAIHRADGSLRGVLTAPLGLAWLNRTSDSTHLPPGSVVATFDTDGTFLQRSEQADRYIGRKASPESRRRFAERPSGSFVVDGVDGVERLVVFRRLRSAGGARITVAAGIPTSEVFAEADRIGRGNLIGLAAAFGIALLLCSVAAGRLIVAPVRRLGETAGRIAAGDLDARTGMSARRGELGHLAWSFDATAEALQARVREAEDTAIRVATLAEQRRQLVAEALGAEDRERAQLSEALHDNALQTLLAARQELAEAAKGDSEALARGRAQLEDVRRSLRDLISDLSPAVLEYSMLGATVRSVVLRHAEAAGLNAVVEVDDEISSDHDQLIVRATGELMTNIVKHASATSVRCSLSETAGEVELRLSDDGRGFVPDLVRAVQHGHVGLASLASRAEAVGGALDFSPGTGGGTDLRLRVPR